MLPLGVGDPRLDTTSSVYCLRTNRAKIVRGWLMLSVSGFWLVMAVGTSPNQPVNRNSGNGAAVNPMLAPEAYQPVDEPVMEPGTPLVVPSETVSKTSAYCCAKFHVTVETLEIVNTTWVPLPELGAEPVPVQPVQT